MNKRKLEDISSCSQQDWLNPPSPSLLLDASMGQRLLNLCKTLERNAESVSHNDTVLQETLDLIQQLIALVQRRGLLSGNAELAQRVLSGAATDSSRPPRKNRGAHRSTTTRSNDLTLHNDVDKAMSVGASAALDVQLLVSAVVRVVERTDSAPSVVAAAADLITAACEYTKVLSTTVSADHVCFLAEYELVAHTGKALLSGMEKHVRRILQTVSTHEMEAMYTVGACFRASSSLVSLFGTRLSRSTALRTSLYETAWTTLSVTVDHSVNEFALHGATTLLATLVLVGGTESTPSVAWSQAVANVVAVVLSVIRHVAPVVVDKKPTESSRPTGPDGAMIWNIKDQWLAKIADTNDESTKARLFLQLLERLVGYGMALLARDALRVTASPASTLHVSLLGGEVNALSMLHVVETMLVFSMACEAKYYGTKKRLRHEPVDGGLLSATVLTGHVAIAVRLQGHRLLDAMVTTLGADSLVPYARRVWKLVHTAVLSSSSSALRRVMEPSSATQLDGKWQRWLHTSLVARTAAVDSMRHAVHVLGTDARSTGQSYGPASGHAVERSITLVCGHVMERLTTGATDLDWGSLEEQMDLLDSCAGCLTAVLHSGGEYLPMTTRELMDSVASSCLMAVAKGHVLVTRGHVKASVLHFGRASVVTAWPDGAASSLNIVRSVAHSCLQDGDASVVAAATGALHACEALACPRVPAWHVVTRSSHASRQTKTFTADTLTSQLDSTRAEIERAREVQESAETRDNGAKKAKPSAAATAQESTTSVTVTMTEPNQPARTVPPQLQSTEDAHGTSTLETFASVTAHQETVATTPASNVENIEDDNEVTKPKAQVKGDDDEFDFPSIVDCPPDEEDM